MENGQKSGNGNGNGVERAARSFDDRPPIQFVRVSMSEDGKWFFIDTVSRACIHVNYVRTIDRNKIASLAQAAASSPTQPVGGSESQAAASKPKRARKENDRTT